MRTRKMTHTNTAAQLSVEEMCNTVCVADRRIVLMAVSVVRVYCSYGELRVYRCSYAYVIECKAMQLNQIRRWAQQ